MKFKKIIALSLSLITTLPTVYFVTSCFHKENKINIENIFYDVELFSQKIPSEINSEFLSNNIEIEINEKIVKNNKFIFRIVDTSDYYGWIKFEILDGQNKKISEEIIIDNFKTKKINFDANIVPVDLKKEYANFLFSVTSSIIFQNNENALFNGTGRFIDFYENLDQKEKYPLRWYFLTNSHVANIKNILNDNLKSIYLINKNENFEHKNKTKIIDFDIVFSGENLISDKNESENFLKNSDGYILDVAIIEINFENEEVAKKATNNIYEKLKIPEFRKSFTSYKIHTNKEQNENLVALSYFSYDENNKNSYDDFEKINFYFNTNSRKMINSNYIEKRFLKTHKNSKKADLKISYPNDFLNYKEKKYKTTGLIYVGSFLQFGDGSSGTPIYDISENIVFSTLHFASFNDKNSNLSLALRTKNIELDNYYKNYNYFFKNYDIFAKNYYEIKNNYPYQNKSYFTELEKKYGTDFKTFLSKNINI